MSKEKNEYHKLIKPNAVYVEYRVNFVRPFTSLFFLHSISLNMECQEENNKAVLESSLQSIDKSFEETRVKVGSQSL